MGNYNSITFRLSAIFVSLIITFTIVILSYNYSKSSQSTYLLLYKLTDRITNIIIEKTNFYINKTNSHIKILTNMNTSDNVLNYKENSLNLMKESIKTEKHLASFFTADNNGNFLQVRRDPRFAIREIINNNTNKPIEKWNYTNENFQSLEYKEFQGSYDPRIRGWFKESKENTIKVSNPYIYESTGKLGITISYPKFVNNEKTIVTAVDITLDTLSDFLYSLSKDISGNIIIVDNEDRIISSSIHSENLMFEHVHSSKKKHIMINSAQRYLMGEETGNFSNTLFIGKTFNVDENKSWHIIITIPEKVILKEAIDTLQNTLIISILILIFFVFLSVVLSKQITKPIIKLSKEMDELHHLNFNVKIDCNSNIEEISHAQKSLLSLKNAVVSFSKYMPSDLVKRLIETNQETTVGGVEKDLVIMFTDIDGFTTLSENISPKELTLELSRYFSQVSQIIKENEGTIDKFIGDSVMAFWGAPTEVINPVEKAVNTAIIIQKKLDILNDIAKKENKLVFKTRIGIHYGKTLVGNIGSNNRMNYTIIGDSVNIAARLENINKKYNTPIMISEEVNQIIKDKFETKFVDEIELKGKTKSTKIYTIL